MGRKTKQKDVDDDFAGTSKEKCENSDFQFHVPQFAASVPKFNGKNFEDFAFGFRHALTLHELDSTLDVDNEEFDKKKNSLAVMLYMKNVEPQFYTFVKAHEHFGEAWRALTKVYGKSSQMDQLILRGKWQTLKYESGELEMHFRQFDDIVTELRAAGVKLTESEVVEQLILSMGPNYEAIVASLGEIDDKMTVDAVKKRFLVAQLRKNINQKAKPEEKVVNDAQEGKLETTAFHSHTRSNNNNYRGGYNNRGGRNTRGRDNNNYGNRSYENREANNRNRSDNRDEKRSSFFRGECNYCRKYGHKASSCRKRLSSMNQNHQNSNTSSSANATFAEGVAEPRDKPVSFIACYEADVKDSQETPESSSSKIRFYLDSCANRHITNNENIFSKFIVLKNPLSVKVAKNNVGFKVTKIGTVNCVTNLGVSCSIKNVLYSPDAAENLLSLRVLDKLGFGMNIKDSVINVFENDRKVLSGEARGLKDLYETELFVNVQASAMISDTELNLWHRRLCHLNTSYVDRLFDKKMVFGMDSKPSDSDVCEACAKGKGARQWFDGTRKRATSTLDLVHTDVCGPITPNSRDDERYFASFIDDYSHFAVIYIMKQKGELFQKLQDFVAQCRTQFGKTVKAIRCDQGGEYTSNNVKVFCRNNGIDIQYTPRYTPQLNGVSERMNRTLVEKAVTMIADSNVPRNMWPEAIRAVTYCQNRSPTTAIADDKTPAELWYNEKPNVTNLRIFGCVAYVLVPKELRQKLDVHAERCAFVGYGLNGWYFYHESSGRVIYSRDVVNWLENEMYFTKIETTPMLTANTVEVTQFEPLMGYFTAEDMKVDVTSNEWKSAIDDELKAIEDNEVWEYVDDSDEIHKISTRWIFKIKEIDGKKIHKARLVARGFEKSSIDSETRAPVAKLSTFRILLSISAAKKLDIFQCDVRNAFLNGELNETVYLEAPEHVNVPKGKVIKLKKAIYGLKEAPYIWNRKITEVLKELKFVQSKNDYCLFVRSDNCYVLVYVDDILIATNDERIRKSIQSKLETEFKMKFLGNIKSYLGISVIKEGNCFKINQQKLIEDVARRFRVENSKPIKTPIEEKLQIRINEGDEATKYPFKELLGSLVYIMMATRPDVCYSISYFSRFQDRATDEVFFYLLRVLEYLYHTRTMSLEFKADKSEMIEGYADADYANDVNDRKSISGNVFTMCGDTISWSSKKQKTVALSSTEAEFISTCGALCELLHLSYVLNDMRINVKKPIFLFQDNQSAIKLLNNFENNSRCKHMAVKENFIVDYIKRGIVNVKYLPSEVMLADMFTKGLSSIKFSKFRDQLKIT